MAGAAPFSVWFDAVAAAGRTPIWQVVLLFIPIVFGVVCLVVLVVGIVKVIVGGSGPDSRNPAVVGRMADGGSAAPNVP